MRSAKRDLEDAENKIVELEKDLAGCEKTLIDVMRERNKLKAEKLAAEKDYYDLVDAVCRESSSVADACRQARETRTDMIIAHVELKEIYRMCVLWKRKQRLRDNRRGNTREHMHDPGDVMTEKDVEALMSEGK